MYVYGAIKNIFDRILSISVLLVLLPSLTVVGLLIKLEDGGSIFVIQKRTGKNMRRFSCIKFRTMTATNIAFDINNPIIHSTSQSLTRIGKFLRKFKIDELPQLLNVIKGDMSLIAPRPLLPEYEEEYKDWEKIKFKLRPGMTGLGQVKGGGYLSIRDRNYYDVKYVLTRSLWLDISIFFKTIALLIVGEEKFVRHVTAEEYDGLRTRAQRMQDLERKKLQERALRATKRSYLD